MRTLRVLQVHSARLAGHQQESAEPAERCGPHSRTSLSSMRRLAARPASVSFGWRGRTAAYWTLGGFALLVLGYFGSKLVLEVLLKRSI